MNAAEARVRKYLGGCLGGEQAISDLDECIADRVAEVKGELDRTEQQIHESGGFIDRMVDAEQALSELAARVREHEPFEAQGELFCGGCEWGHGEWLNVGFVEHILGAQS